MSVLNACINAVISELEAVGLKPVLMHGGKHQTVCWQHNNTGRKFVVPTSPSDWRAPMNARSDIRKILKADGLIVEEKEAATPVVWKSPVFLDAGRAFCSSRDVAATFGKLHKNVLRDADAIIAQLGDEFGRLNFEPSSYLTEQSKEIRSYNISRDGFTILAMGFSGADALKWKAKYIDAFNSMENQILKIKALPVTDEGILKRIAKLENDVEGIISISSTPLLTNTVTQVIEPQAIVKTVEVIKEVVRVVKEEFKVPIFSNGKINYMAALKKCAESVRLPPRPGYSIIPERYKRNLEPLGSSIEERKEIIKEVRLGATKPKKRYNLTPQGLIKILENAKLAREVRSRNVAQRRAAKGS